MVEGGKVGGSIYMELVMNKQEQGRFEIVRNTELFLKGSWVMAILKEMDDGLIMETSNGVRIINV